MIQKSKSTGDKPRGKGKARGGKQRNTIPKSKTWEFKPKLKNEAIVLHSILGLYDVPYYEEIVKDIRELVTSLIRNHGFTDGPARYNVIKQYTIELIEFRSPENPGWLATSDSWRVPSKLGINTIKLIVDYFNVSDSALQKSYYKAIITILNIPRIVEGLSDADYNSVTQKAHPIREDLLKDFSIYIDKVLDSYVYDKTRRVNLSSYKVNFMKNGPNGRPKLESATDEAVSLLSDRQLARPFQHLCEELGIPHLFSYVSALTAQVTATRESDSAESPDNSACLRRLVEIPDSGMKTRIVAIVDFWSQLALEPLRTHVQSVTRRLYGNTDFRVNQNLGVEAMVDFQKRCLAEEVIGSHTLNIEKLKFYDISSWTDRFHRDLQKEVIVKLFGSRLAQAWAQLVVHCSWQVGRHDRTIKYGQGQGMGTNGSFDVATLTDHLYINFMYETAYTDKSFIGSNCYGKVGDDLWIYDPEDLYPKFCEEINLPINFSKSKTFCKLGSIAEFCSRTFIDGVDVSRISPRIISRSNDFRYLPLLLSFCCSRGIQLYRSSFEYLDRTVKNSEESYFDKLQPWILSVFTVSSDNFSHLTLEYLKEGSWLTSDTERIISDQASLARIQAARTLVQLNDFARDVEMKTSEAIEAEGNLSMEDVYVLSSGRYDIFDLKSPVGACALEWFETDNKVLTPKQIFVLGRYIVQNHLVSQKFYELYELDPRGDSYITDAKDILEEISTRSVYDQGNINYDQAAYISMQFGMVKILQRLDDEFKTLSLSQSEVDRISQIIGESLLQSRIVEDFIRISVEEHDGSEIG